MDTAENITFSEYMGKIAWQYMHFIVVAQVFLVPLHIFTTDYIDVNISFTPLSIGLRLVAVPLFLISYFLVKLLKGNFQIYFVVSFFINAIGDSYLASISAEEYLVTHLLGLTVVFIAYALLAVWHPLFYHLTLISVVTITGLLFYFNSPLPLITIMKEGGAFLMFLIVISSIINILRYNALKINFSNNNKIRDKNEQLKQNLDELATSQESLKTERDNLEQALEKLNTTQNQLVKAERMASVGKMTDGIAHEINNPLNFVSGGLQGLSGCMPDLELALKVCQNLDIEPGGSQEPEVIQMVQQVREAGDLDELIEDIQYLFQDIASGVDRISSVVKGLQLFTRSENEQTTQANIHESIEVAVLAMNKKSGVQLAQSFDSEIPYVNCYPSQLTQAIANILSNALDAVAEGGKISISTKQENDFARIDIIDNGEGMSEAVEAKIFEPFFTQKDVGKGIGLGLSVAHGIIEKHLGYIEVESQEGIGSTFSIFLPIS